MHHSTKTYKEDDATGHENGHNTSTMTPLLGKQALHLVQTPASATAGVPSPPDTCSSLTVADTPMAVEPSPLVRNKTTNDDNPNKVDNHEYQVVLEGIPENACKHKSTTSNNQLEHDPPPPPDGYDDGSLESILSSLGEEEDLACDWSLEDPMMTDNDNHLNDTTNTASSHPMDLFFTPLEQRPSNRMERLERELQLRTELLQYLLRGQGQDAVPPGYAARLERQEAVVQQWTLECARRREHLRRMRKQARRQRRKRQQLLEQQEQHMKDEETTPNTSPALARNNNDTPNTTNNPTSNKESSEEEEVKPKSLFEKDHNMDETHPQPSMISPSHQTTLSSSPPLFSYWEFEWYHGLPAILSLLLVCVAHAAVYELIMGIVLVGMQPFLSYRILTDSEDRILELPSDFVHVEDVCYGLVLLVSLLVARTSGLLYSVSKKGNFLGSINSWNNKESNNNDDEDDDDGDDYVQELLTEAQRQQQLLLHPQRIDRKWAQWMQSTGKGRMVKGFLDVVSFYLCFVAVMYFLGRFALIVDQRASMLHNMPSNQHNVVAASTNNPQDEVIRSLSTHDNYTTASISSYLLYQDPHGAVNDRRMCPVDPEYMLLPYMKDALSAEDSSSSDDSDSDSDVEKDDDNKSVKNDNQNQFHIEFGVPECDEDDEDEDKDDFGNPIIYEGGSEDEEYLYRRLSASAYHQFWGYGYRAALFDLPHQLFFNFACSAVAMFALKRYFGCSIWEDW